MAKRVVKNKSSLHNQSVKPVTEAPKPVENKPKVLKNKRIVSKASLEQRAQTVEPAKPEPPKENKVIANTPKKRVVKRKPVEDKQPGVIISETPTIEVPAIKLTEDLSYHSPKEESKAVNLDEVADVLVEELVEKFITRDEIESVIENTIKKMIIVNSTPEPEKPPKKVMEKPKPELPKSQGMVFQPISRKKNLE